MMIVLFQRPFAFQYKKSLLYLKVISVLIGIRFKILNTLCADTNSKIIVDHFLNHFESTTFIFIFINVKEVEFFMSTIFNLYNMSYVSILPLPNKRNFLYFPLYKLTT